jgi:glycosyltransferase involved in cell wall biosynthesis
VYARVFEPQPSPIASTPPPGYNGQSLPGAETVDDTRLAGKIFDARRVGEPGMTDVERPSILITYPFPLGTKAAGGSRTTPEVARHLGKLGADVTILAVSTNALDRRFPREPPPDDELGHHLDEPLAADSVRIVRVPQHPLHFQFDPHQVKGAVRRILRERRVDLVLAHYNEAGCLGPLLRRHGIPFGFLATWQTYAYLARSYAGWWGRLKRWAEVKYTIRPHQEADILFAISEFTRGELIDILGVRPERIVVAPLGVQPTFTEIPRAKPEAITRFLFFGRLVPEKGIFDALEALGKLAARGQTDWTYRMVGQGRHDLVRETAERLGIADRISLAGPTDDRGLQRELQEAHLAIMPSHAESFGLSIAEAQGAGIPVVAYAAGSVPEVVADGETGWLAPLHDSDRLSQLIESAIADPERTYATGLAARARVERRFNWTNTARIILEGLRSLDRPRR